MGFLAVSGEAQAFDEFGFQDRKILCCWLDSEIVVANIYFKSSFEFLERKNWIPK